VEEGRPASAGAEREGPLLAVDGTGSETAPAGLMLLAALLRRVVLFCRGGRGRKQRRGVAQSEEAAIKATTALLDARGQFIVYLMMLWRLVDGACRGY